MGKLSEWRDKLEDIFILIVTFLLVMFAIVVSVIGAITSYKAFILLWNT